MQGQFHRDIEDTTNRERKVSMHGKPRLKSGNKYIINNYDNNTRVKIMDMENKWHRSWLLDFLLL